MGRIRGSEIDIQAYWVGGICFSVKSLVCTYRKVVATYHQRNATGTENVLPFQIRTYLKKIHACENIIK